MKEPPGEIQFCVILTLVLSFFMWLLNRIKIICPSTQLMGSNYHMNQDLKLWIHIKIALTPFTPFFSLSSMKRERYSGDLGFKLRKCSKSDAIICLNILSLLKELWRKWSNLSLRSSKFCEIKKLIKHDKNLEKITSDSTINH